MSGVFTPLWDPGSTVTVGGSGPPGSLPTFQFGGKLTGGVPAVFPLHSYFAFTLTSIAAVGDSVGGEIQLAVNGVAGDLAVFDYPTKTTTAINTAVAVGDQLTLTADSDCYFTAFGTRS